MDAALATAREKLAALIERHPGAARSTD
jgi:hypothetical protein